MPIYILYGLLFRLRGLFSFLDLLKYDEGGVYVLALVRVVVLWAIDRLIDYNNIIIYD